MKQQLSSILTTAMLIFFLAPVSYANDASVQAPQAPQADVDKLALARAEKLFSQIRACIESNNEKIHNSFPVLEIEANDEIIAYSTTKKIVFSTGLIALAKEVNNLAFAMAHEISHHLLDHFNKQMQASPGEGFEDWVTHALRRSIFLEVEADRSAIIQMRLCRFKTDGIPDFLNTLLKPRLKENDAQSLGLLYHERMKNIIPAIQNRAAQPAVQD